MCWTHDDGEIHGQEMKATGLLPQPAAKAETSIWH
jgi:hypothetical protein